MTPATRPARRRPAHGSPAGLARTAPGGPHPAGRVDEIAALLGAHVDRLSRALPALQAATPTLARWGEDLGRRLLAGNRLLVRATGAAPRRRST